MINTLLSQIKLIQTLNRSYGIHSLLSIISYFLICLQFGCKLDGYQTNTQKPKLIILTLKLPPGPETGRGEGSWQAKGPVAASVFASTNQQQHHYHYYQIDCKEKIDGKEKTRHASLPRKKNRGWKGRNKPSCSHHQQQHHYHYYQVDNIKTVKKSTHKRVKNASSERDVCHRFEKGNGRLVYADSSSSSDPWIDDDYPDFIDEGLGSSLVTTPEPNYERSSEDDKLPSLWEEYNELPSLEGEEVKSSFVPTEDKEQFLEPSDKETFKKTVFVSDDEKD